VRFIVLNVITMKTRLVLRDVTPCTFTQLILQSCQQDCVASDGITTDDFESGDPGLIETSSRYLPGMTE
jgi:hypothetical protein